MLMSMMKGLPTIANYVVIVIVIVIVVVVVVVVVVVIVIFIFNGERITNHS